MDIDGTGFSGSNNVKTKERFFSKKGIIEPRVILNADVDVTGTLIKRAGKTLYIALPGAHSLWAGATCMLSVANGVLYRVYQGEPVAIANVSPVDHPYSYIDAEDKVYISNPYWQGVLNPVDNSVASWGVALPPSPLLLLGNGNLPAGTYYVCMTNVVNGELSGNSQIANITLTQEGGISILNRPAGAQVWMTDANEGIFYLVGSVDTIVYLPTANPLPTFMCSPPPYLENLCYAFGRIWGSYGNDVYYCQPFKLGLFKLTSNVYHYQDPVTMIAKVPTGLFIGMENRTKFLLGTIPEQMVEQDAGAGSVKGTLSYCNNMPELGWTLGTPEKDFTDVPMWLTTEGIVVGSVTGKFFNVTKNKLKMGIPNSGASLYRNLEGIIQFLASFKSGITGTAAGFEDEDTMNVFKNGRIDIHRVMKMMGMGSSVGFGDDCSCVVTRNGVII